MKKDKITKKFHANYRLILCRVWEIDRKEVIVEAYGDNEIDNKAKYKGSFYKFVKERK